jgi:hypothetical protein
MCEFRGQVEEIIHRLSKNDTGKMNINNLAKITADTVGTDQVNCYPGISGNKCYKEAYFYSLDKNKYAKTRGKNLSLGYILTKVVQHMIGHCEGETRFAVIITDNWNDDTFEPWRSTFKKILQNGGYIEIYVLMSGSYHEIKI